MTRVPLDHHDERTQPLAQTARGVGPAVILVGYNRTEGSGGAHALSYAAGLAARNGARLAVVSVDESLELACPPSRQDCHDRVTGEVRRIIGGCTDDCNVVVEIGDPVGVLARVADDLQADVIVVGACRHPWLHPLGSVPGRLVRRAKQPVLVVP